MPMHTDRCDFLDLSYDRLTFAQVISVVKSARSCRDYGYVVTPNVDHVVRLRRDAPFIDDLKAAYHHAELCVCDSRILSLLARSRGVSLPVVPGSDLAAQVLKNVVQPNDKIAIVGGDSRLLNALQATYPQTRFVQQHLPMGLLENAAARTAAARFIAEEQARFTFIVVGSPQQELIAAEVREFPQARGLAFCVGAALEFLTGQQKRAPKAMQKLHLEWAYRLISEPSRMWRRYLVEGPRIFVIAARWNRDRQEAQ